MYLVHEERYFISTAQKPPLSPFYSLPQRRLSREDPSTCCLGRGGGVVCVLQKSLNALGLGSWNEEAVTVSILISMI